MLLLEVDELSYAAPARRSVFGVGRALPILNEISFSVDEGEMLAVVGRSGSGKTTLARCLAGLLAPTSGRVRLAERGPGSPPPVPNASPIQMLFQDHTASLDPTATVATSIREGLEGAQRPVHPAALRSALEAVGLPSDLLPRLPAELSGGERQRVALARILAAAPRVIVADEPTSALDGITADRVLDVLASACRERGVALLLVTHDAEAARRSCPRVIVLHEGRLVDDGTWESLERTPRHKSTRTLLGLLPVGSAA
jgi:peptide/nickel transport system ATP-binding protein